MLGTSDPISHSQHVVWDVLTGALKIRREVIYTSVKRRKMYVLENLHIYLNKRKNAFINEQSGEDIPLFEIISKLQTSYTLPMCTGTRLP
jgi:hypothetical protein